MDPGVSVQNKNFSGSQRRLQKFLEPDRKPKVIYTDNSIEFGKACEDFLESNTQARSFMARTLDEIWKKC